jgi:hypothetical protein
MSVSFRVLAVVTVLGLPCGNMLAQVDVGVLQVLYQDMQSSDQGTRFKAFQTIHANEEFLKSPETSDRFLAFLDLERQVIHRRYLSGEGYGEGWSEDYAVLLGTTWGLWKDKLTPHAFRVLAEASYNPHSQYAEELGTRAGRFVGELLPLTSLNRDVVDQYTRENAVALVGYALAEDAKGTVPVGAAERVALTQGLAKAALDSAPGPRWQVVKALKLAGGSWAILILDKMYEREPSFYPGGRDSNILEEAKAEMKSAILAIRSRGGQPVPESK